MPKEKSVFARIHNANIVSVDCLNKKASSSTNARESRWLGLGGNQGVLRAGHEGKDILS
jgi:hypothetical protein